MEVVGINITALKDFKEKSEVTLESLKKAGIVGKRVNKVKILGNGELKVALKIKLPCSKEATKKIEKSGGTVILS